MKQLVFAAIFVIFASFPLQAAEVTLSDIRSDPSAFLKKTVTLNGVFLYAEPMRMSFSIDQGGASIEIFYSDLPKGEQEYLATLKQNSKTPVTVTGTIQQYTNKPGSYFMNAASMQMPLSAGTGQSVARTVRFADIKAAPENYLGKPLSLQGALASAEPARQSFTLEHEGTMIEVFYNGLPKAGQDFVLRQSKSGRTRVIVSGVMKEYTNRQGAYFMNATAITPE